MLNIAPNGQCSCLDGCEDSAQGSEWQLQFYFIQSIFFISILDFHCKASRTLVFGHKKLQMVPHLFAAVHFVVCGYCLIKQGEQKNFISNLKYVILGSITECISSLQSILKVLYLFIYFSLQCIGVKIKL